VRRVGILGGTFNPPHVGHLVCAQEAHAQLGLDVVILMPAHTPPHKPPRDDPGPGHRLELCQRAAEGDERLEVSGLEVERGGPSYTVDTLETLHEERPGDELTWIAGGDMAAGLPDWREPERVLELARFAVAEREGADRARIERVVASLAGREAVTFFDMPRLDVSSSMIRTHVGAGRPVRWLVPDPVADYIRDHGLYRSAVGAR
jgi:nicotinate-nucleotide adenylyltransferase